ncbi:hypothetical protein lerEdw1_010079 [Lerista edwardsae]|nr:hypothetical protein lerEdw1_010079 [Lerista edwardsae]
MDYITETCPVPCGQDKYISKNELLLHLKTYNLYYEGQNLQLRHREEEGEFIVEGLLNISWGLRRPIRLQMQDDNQRIRPPPSSSSWHSGCNLGAHGSVIKPSTLPDIQVTEAESMADSDETDGRVGQQVYPLFFILAVILWGNLGGKRVPGQPLSSLLCFELDCSRVKMKGFGPGAWDVDSVGEFPILNLLIVGFAGPKCSTLQGPCDDLGVISQGEKRGIVDAKDLNAPQEDAPQLMRTRSDVGVRRRGNLRTPSEQRRIKRHRFSINGHFYNHKTSVFTPAYGSITNVRINSTMTTPQVLKLLLNKFKIENSAEEFALYIVHTSGEKHKLKATDYPLIARILQGPCEQVCKVFLMEKDQVEEVTYDVAQYIKFEMPVLKSFIQKLKEEEDREVKKLRHKCGAMRKTWASWCWAAFLLLALFSNAALCRRGGGGRGGSAGGKGGSRGSSRGGFHAPPKGSGQSQAGSGSRGMKVAGAAAAGAAVGYGLSSLGRSRVSRGGHGSLNGKQMAQPGFQNPNWSDPMAEGTLYSGVSKEDLRAAKLLAWSPVMCGIAYVLARG